MSHLITPEGVPLLNVSFVFSAYIGLLVRCVAVLEIFDAKQIGTARQRQRDRRQFAEYEGSGDKNHIYEIEEERPKKLNETDFDKEGKGREHRTYT